MRIGVICGGRSAEHDVSLRSAQSVAAALVERDHQVEVIYIARDGRWQRIATTALIDGTLASSSLLPAKNGVSGKANGDDEQLTIVAREGGAQLLSIGSGTALALLDVMFPVLHGPNGEDGAIQGMLRTAGVAFVGADVLGSAVCMDKDVSKRLLCAANIPVAQTRVVRAKIDQREVAELVEAIGLPLFVKPANLGSSVGVSKVTRQTDLAAAVELALSYDAKALVEEFIDARELEVSVVGNEVPSASVVGEIVTATSHQFYDYRAKYLDQDGAELVIPAPLPAPVADEVRRLARAAYATLCVEGMARVDFFLRRVSRNGGSDLIVNEVNTIPGFTDISMFAKLWAASGVGFGELIERLASLALERQQRQDRRRVAPEHDAAARRSGP